MGSRVSVVIGLALAACTTGGEGPTAPAPRNLTGRWHFTWHAMASPALSCGIVADFDLYQNGTSFTGYQADDAQLRCTSAGVTVIDALIFGETIINGLVAEAGVSFRLGSIAGAHAGSVAGAMMEGTGAWEYTEDGQRVVLAGRWSAIRR
jgi:hypothetical protein